MLGGGPVMSATSPLNEKFFGEMAGYVSSKVLGAMILENLALNVLPNIQDRLYPRRWWCLSWSPVWGGLDLPCSKPSAIRTAAAIDCREDRMDASGNVGITPKFR